MCSSDLHPYDLSEAQPFSMSYLSGFQAEKRDIEKSDIQMMVDQKIDEYCKEVLAVNIRVLK